MQQSFRLLVAVVAVLACVVPSEGNLGKINFFGGQDFKQGVGGGIECAACTIVLSITEQLSVIHNKTMVVLLDEICGWLFPANFDSICQYYVDNYGAEVIKLFDEGFNADEICHGISFCTLPQCHIWPQSGRGMPKPLNSQNVHTRFPFKRPKRDIQQNPWQWLLDLLAPIIQRHEPELDIDGDLFSFEPPLRGSSWRGRDCNDLDVDQHPGRKVTTEPPEVDHNCNGIFEKNGIDYEQLYCANSGQVGTIVLGDSAGAHFEIPPNWMNATAMNNSTFSDLLFVLSNELDWPERSATTGYVPSTSDYIVHSLYLNLRNRNRCNHRDYQNICLNGLRSGPTLDMSYSIYRNQTLDYPVILVLELIGNDVCSGHPDFDHYTPPAEFKQNILNVLYYLNSTLPKGSHILFLGLAQGGILYETMHARTHPIGCDYAAVYEFLNCLEISPCWTWMNSNATVRAKGDAWAAMLSNIYQEIVDSYTFMNFDMAYYPFPLQQIYEMWMKQGGQGLWQLIEPIDGFHPNQISNYLTADWSWQTLSQDHPDWLGPVNPNNQNIQNVFGDQGGY